jgi:ATP-binding cassette subfamily B protein
LGLKVQLTIYNKINKLEGLGPFEDPRFHNAIQLASDAQYAPQQIIGNITTLVSNSVTLVVFAIAMMAINQYLTAFVALAALPELYTQLKMGQKRFSIATENATKQRHVSYYGNLLSNITFAKEMRLFSLASHFLNSFRCLVKELHQIQRLQQLREMHWQLGLGIFSNIVSSATFIAVVLQAYTGRLSLGDVSIYSIALRNIQGAMSGLIATLANIGETLKFFTHYTDLIMLPQPIVIVSSPRNVPPLMSGIDLRNVSFRYSDKHPWVLRDINFSIPAGKCLALVGLNGAGKTTLIKLLSRLYDPTEGRITWDRIDLREFEPKDLRAHVGVIFQDFVRYDLTAYENIALGDVNHLNDKFSVQQAAMRAGIHERIEMLPHGYQTTLSRHLSEGSIGVDLSGGEWQKIALARLFMRKADLLILDEPTATLDAQSEYDLYCRFSDLVAGKTSLLISHRFSTVHMADLIAVIRDGQITECGTHGELIALKAAYARMYNMQARHYR